MLTKAVQQVGWVFMLGMTSAALGQAWFQPMQPQMGDDQVWTALVSDISGDGNFVVGNALTLANENLPFRWSQKGGMEILDGFPDGCQLWPHATSFDGSVVVGRAACPHPYNHLGGFRWTQSGGACILEDEGLDVSDNGSIAVGHRYRWDNCAGIEIDFPNSVYPQHDRVNAISGDGSVLAGFTFIDSFNSSIPQVSHPESRVFQGEGVATATDGVGWVVAGVSSATSGPFRWASTIEPPDPLGHVGGTPTDMSADGTIIVGNGVGDGVGPRAFVWDEQGCGMTRLDTLLSEMHGVDIGEWGLEDIGGVSADGLTVAGIGRNTGMNRHEGFIAHIPRLPFGILKSYPASGTIDSRRETAVPGDAFNSNKLLFSRAPHDAFMDTPANISSFTVVDTFGTEPPITYGFIDNDEACRYRIDLGHPIAPGAWTLFIANVRDPAGGTIQPPQTDTVKIGYLPGDVDGDAVVTTDDLSTLLLALAGTPPLALTSTDIDRSGIPSAEDLLAALNLFNGASGGTAWLGVSLPILP